MVHEETSQLKSDVSTIEILNPLEYPQRTLSVIGVWPEQYRTTKGDIAYSITFCYFAIAITLIAYGAYKNSHVLDVLIIIVLELILTGTNFIYMYILRASKDLERVIVMMKKEIKDGTIFENEEEKCVYLPYNRLSYYYSKYAITSAFCISYLMYFVPLIELAVHFHADLGNTTRTYEMPFPLYIMFDYEHNAWLYACTYIAEFFFTYVGIIHTSIVSFEVDVVLHICGKLCIMCHRIRTIPAQPPELFEKSAKRMASSHVKLTKSLQNVNDSLSIILLMEYFSCTSRLGLSLYVVLTALETNPVAATKFFMYTLQGLSLIFLYSYVGEIVLSENENVENALSDIDWPEVAIKDRRTFLIFLVNAQQALYLTGGKFYKFSLYGFTDVIKSAMAFLSMLRATM